MLPAAAGEPASRAPAATAASHGRPCPAAAVEDVLQELGDGRHRDIFPLPEFDACGRGPRWRRLSRATRQRVARSLHWKEWAADGVAALNELAGGRPGAPRSASLPAFDNLAQELAFKHVEECYRSFPPPPADLPRGEAALSALLSQAAGYA
eukprot:4563478-Lingulodinium_polyedra.AAC.1